jgi:hypothetical protein
MVELLQVLVLTAVPAAFLLTMRFIIMRQARLDAELPEQPTQSAVRRA